MNPKRNCHRLKRATPTCLATNSKVARRSVSQNLSSSTKSEKGFISEKTTPSLDLQVVRLLAQGGFGKVFLVKTRDDLSKNLPSSGSKTSDCTKFVRNKAAKSPKKRGNKGAKDEYHYYAMKTLLKKTMTRSTWHIERVLTEQRVWSKLKHPFITECFMTFQTKKQLLFFSEYIQGGELFEFLQHFGPLSESNSKFYLCEVLIVLEYLHSKDIIYRDLKPENVMLCKDGHVKLIDFGLCRDNFRLPVGRRVCSATRCGSEGFMAPEVYREKFYGFAADWWSYGALAYYLMTGNTPFVDQNYKGPVQYPKTMSKEAITLIARLLDLNKGTRLGRLKGAQSVSCHRFFQDVNWDRVKTKGMHPPFVLRSDIQPGDHGCFPSTENKRVSSVLENPELLNVKPDPFANFDYVNDDRLDEI